MTSSPTAADTIGERVATELRAAAARKGVSGAEVARRMGMPPLWVQRRMSGTVECTVEDLVDLCAGLDVHVLDLVAQVLVDSGRLERDTT